MADKSLFSYDQTPKVPTGTADNNPFVSARISDELRERSDAQSRALLEDIKKNLRLPLMLGAALLLAMGVWLLFGFLDPIINDGVRASFADQLRAEGWVFWVSIGLLLLSVVCLVIRHRQIKAYENGETRATLLREIDELGELTRRELGIPEQTVTLDILPYQYKIIDGEEQEYIEQDVYQNSQIQAWRDGDSVCLTDDDCVMRVPVSAFTGYYTVNSPYVISMWWKDTEYNEGEYKQYHIRLNSDRNYALETYYDVVIADGEDHYDLLIPCYDFSAFCGLVELNCLDGEEPEIIPDEEPEDELEAYDEETDEVTEDGDA